MTTTFTGIEESQLTRFLNGEVKNSKIWSLVEVRDYKNKVVVYLPTGERMLAVTWMPFKWVINKPSIGNV